MVTELAGARSPRVRAARQLARRAMRERSRLFLAEGPQAVREALDRANQAAWSGGPGQAGPMAELFVTAQARARHGELVAELAQTVTPQGLLAVCRFVDIPLAGLVAAAPRLVVMLANVRDPGNA